MRLGPGPSVVLMLGFMRTVPAVDIEAAHVSISPKSAVSRKATRVEGRGGGGTMASPDPIAIIALRFFINWIRVH